MLIKCTVGWPKSRKSPHLRIWLGWPPTNEKFTVGRKPNAEYPLTGASYRGEVERLIEAVPRTTVGATATLRWS